MPEFSRLAAPRAFLYGCIGLLSLMTAFPVAAQQEFISNGGFENNGGVGTSSLTGWTIADQTGSSGSWFAQSGTSSPFSSTTVPTPPQGSFAAMSDSGGPGSHVLYQDFIVPASLTSATLSFEVYVQNQATNYFSPASLDFTGPANQQVRVDLLTGASGVFSVAGGDVLLNPFHTSPGDPRTFGYNIVTADITALLQSQSGNTLRLRFAETDNQFLQNFGVDAASLQITGTTTPEPGSLALFASCCMAATGLLRLRRRSQRS